MKDLDGLIARVELRDAEELIAAAADRRLLLEEVDAIARYIFGPAWTIADGGLVREALSSIDAALGLMEHVHGKAVMRRVYDDPDGYGANCDIVLDNGDSVKVRGALTWPLAIILATLRALQSLPEGDVR